MLSLRLNTGSHTGDLNPISSCPCRAHTTALRRIAGTARQPLMRSVVCGSLIAIAWYPCYHVPMIKKFRNKGTEDIFYGKNTKHARKICPESIWKVASRKLDQLDSVGRLDDLKVPPGNMLEALKGDRAGEHSIRINNQFRICFVWSDNAPDQVEVIDYH